MKRWMSQAQNERIARFFTRNGHWVALGVCLALMVGAAAWIGTTELPSDKLPEYDIADGIADTTPDNGAYGGIAAGQEPDFVDRLNLSAATPPPASGAIFVRPVAGETLTAFSNSSPVYNDTLSQWAIHDAVDLSGKAGAPVIAAASGTVTSVADDPLWGMEITISSINDTITRYAGLATVHTTQGATVKAGDVIGTLGTPPAEAALGPHLHLEIARDGQPVDPETLIAPLAK